MTCDLNVVASYFTFIPIYSVSVHWGQGNVGIHKGNNVLSLYKQHFDPDMSEHNTIQAWIFTHNTLKVKYNA